MLIPLTSFSPWLYFLRSLVLGADEFIAIEVDGPHHFTTNTLSPLGEMLARRRLLESRGWEVISVPFFKWSKQPASSQKDYLLQVLHSAGNTLTENHLFLQRLQTLCRGIILNMPSEEGSQ